MDNIQVQVFSCRHNKTFFKMQIQEKVLEEKSSKEKIYEINP